MVLGHALEMVMGFLCCVLSAPVGEDGKNVVRPYTPISNTKTNGFFDMMIKVMGMVNGERRWPQMHSWC